jgi:hypothetical protein
MADLPESDLWAAVLRWAFTDACEETRTATRRDGSSSRSATSVDKIHAWLFLTRETGPWAESRIMICWMCGVDPAVVREEALRRGPCREVQAHRKRVAEQVAARSAPQFQEGQSRSHRPQTMQEARA